MLGRSKALDVFRIVAATLVIVIHTSPLSHISEPMNFMLVNGIARLAVPFFFAVTGYYTALDRPGQLAATLRRIFWLYLLWNLIYLPTGWRDSGVTMSSVLSRILIGYWHLWYLLALMQAFVLMWMIQNLRVSTQAFVVTTLLFIGWGIELWGRSRGYEISLYRNGLFLGLPFLWLGSVARRNGPWFAAWGRGRLMGVWFACFLLLLGEAWALGTISRTSVDILLMLAPTTVIGVYLLASAPWPATSGTLARFSTGMYFSHIWVVILAGKLLDLSPAGTFAVTWVGAACLSLLLIRMGGRLRLV